jgi:hypothetical protein
LSVASQISLLVMGPHLRATWERFSREKAGFLPVSGQIEPEEVTSPPTEGFCSRVLGVDYRLDFRAADTVSFEDKQLVE